MTAILTEIVSLLVGAITGMATGIGEGLSSLVKEIALETVTEGNTTVTKLSVFANFVVIFGGISLAVGLSRKVVSWLGSLGGRKM